MFISFIYVIKPTDSHRNVQKTNFPIAWLSDQSAEHVFHTNAAAVLARVLLFVLALLLVPVPLPFEVPVPALVLVVVVVEVVGVVVVLGRFLAITYPTGY